MKYQWKIVKTETVISSVSDGIFYFYQTKSTMRFERCSCFVGWLLKWDLWWNSSENDEIITILSAVVRSEIHSTASEWNKVEIRLFTSSNHNVFWLTLGSSGVFFSKCRLRKEAKPSGNIWKIKRNRKFRRILRLNKTIIEKLL